MFAETANFLSLGPRPHSTVRLSTNRALQDIHNGGQPAAKKTFGEQLFNSGLSSLCLDDSGYNYALTLDAAAHKQYDQLQTVELRLRGLAESVRLNTAVPHD